MTPKSQVLPLDTLVTGSGPGLLLAHGAGGGVQANFGELIPALSEHHTIVGPDYPGSGHSALGDVPLELDVLADAVVQAALDAGVERFSMLGLSLGAAVAVRAAVRNPERIRALVLTAGFAAPDAEFALKLRVWRDLAATGDRQAVARFLALVVAPTGALADLDPEPVNAIVEEVATGIPLGADAHRELVIGVDTREDLPRVQAPTLVLAPTHDGLVGSQHSRALADGIPNARLETLPGGHVLARGDVLGWRERIESFLRSV